jgi:small subunit ribosomal protein S20
MANHVSALKRARQTVKRTAVNRSNKSHVRKSLRALREAITKGDTSGIAEQYSKTVSALDKSVQKGVLHKYGFPLQKPVARPGEGSHPQSSVAKSRFI